MVCQEFIVVQTSSFDVILTVLKPDTICKFYKIVLCLVSKRQSYLLSLTLSNLSYFVNENSSVTLSNGIISKTFVSCTNLNTLAHVLLIENV